MDKTKASRIATTLDNLTSRDPNHDAIFSYAAEDLKRNASRTKTTRFIPARIMAAINQG